MLKKNGTALSILIIVGQSCDLYTYIIRFTAEIVHFDLTQLADTSLSKIYKTFPTSFAVTSYNSTDLEGNVEFLSSSKQKNNNKKLSPLCKMYLYKILHRCL